jgi:hypothetical protein
MEISSFPTVLRKLPLSFSAKRSNDVSGHSGTVGSPFAPTTASYKKQNPASGQGKLYESLGAGRGELA